MSLAFNCVFLGYRVRYFLTFASLALYSTRHLLSVIKRLFASQTTLKGLVTYWAVFIKGDANYAQSRDVIDGKRGKILTWIPDLHCENKSYNQRIVKCQIEGT